eukprot:GHVS01056419.1.p2 GENE.GHVS01056419.1~~GHVS01056419.1.p2  ORF type:complete len:135 (+),score=13.31 GHVS01056419.1:508-912(+)
MPYRGIQQHVRRLHRQTTPNNVANRSAGSRTHTAISHAGITSIPPASSFFDYARNQAAALIDDGKACFKTTSRLRLFDDAFVPRDGCGIYDHCGPTERLYWGAVDLRLHMPENFLRGDGFSPPTFTYSTNVEMQ